MARASGRQHSRGGVAQGGLRGEVVVAATVSSPVLAVAGGQTGTQRNPRPTRTGDRPLHQAGSCLSDARAPRSRRL